MSRGVLTRFTVVAILGVSGAPGAEAAGLLDELARALFGSTPRYYAPPTYYYNPPNYDEPVMRSPKPRAEVRSKPKPPVVQLDPQTDPGWYLKDPTLRRGDIVVTASGVLVYQGRDSDAMRPADFVALGGSDPKGWKRRLQTAAQGGRNMFGSDHAHEQTVTAEATNANAGR